MNPAEMRKGFLRICWDNQGEPVWIVPAHRRRVAVLLATFLVVLVAAYFRSYDTITAVLLVGAAGILWVHPKLTTVLLSGLLAFAGLGWSSLDPRHCSAWWRGTLVYGKLLGPLRSVPWSYIWRQTTGVCVEGEAEVENMEAQVKLLKTKDVDGHTWEQYRTQLGDFWLPAPGKSLIAFLVLKEVDQSDYENAQVRIHPGDVVIDCGAHVGTFTAYALRHGASQVVAIDPDALNLACLKENFAREISEGRVKPVPLGVWDTRAALQLYDPNPENSGMPTFVDKAPGAKLLGTMPVETLDEIVEELKLERVDFIKMDIEGSERHALRGARKTLERFKPRMAIADYHLPDDPIRLREIATSIVPTYRVFGTHGMFAGRWIFRTLVFCNPPDCGPAPKSR